MGILRGVSPDQIEPLVESAAKAGLETIEITMNTPKAPELIRIALKASRKRLTIGAGTVLNMDNLKSALDAGATFIVTPVLVRDVLEHCVKNKIPSFPGALTPQEIYNAWSSGASMVKVFPAKLFGPEYFSQIKGPFDGIELLACAGVTPENLKSYFSSGASAVSFGSSVFKSEWLKKKDFESIRVAIEGYVKALKQVFA